MKSIFKNFVYVFKRFTSSSLLNFLGLTGAISVFIICFIQAKYDYTYNHNFKNAKDIVVGYVYSPESDSYTNYFSTPLTQKIADGYPHIEEYTNYAHYTYTFKVNNNTERQNIILNKVSKGFLSMFEPEVITGDIERAINTEGHTAITESVALQHFGSTNVLGKAITFYYSDHSLIIDAVIKDFPQNCSFNNGLYTFLADDEPSEYSYLAYFSIDKKQRNGLEEYLASDEFLGIDSQSNEKSNRSTNEFHTMPLKEVHLNKNFGNTRTQLYAFGFVGLIILLIAYINYINFALTTAPSRVKTLNIQRVLGLKKSKQRWVLMTESGLFTLIAFIAAVGIVYLLTTSTMDKLFSAEMTLSANSNFITTCGVLLVVLGVLVGYYPARYATSFEETEALKGGGLNVVSSQFLRNTLLTIQLCAAFALPVITSFVYLQYNYMVNYEWGIEKENIIHFNVQETKQSYETLAIQLTENPAIINYTGSRFIPGNVGMGWGRVWKDKYVSLKSWPVTSNFLNFFGVEIIKGENFPSTEDGTARAILNEKFISTYATDEPNVVGETFPGFSTDMPICGIAKNTNFASLHSEIEPMVFVTIDDQNRAIMFLKLAKGTNLQSTITWIKDTIEKKSSSPIELKFLDKDLEKLYWKESNQARLISYFSLIIIIITLMGVYGLVSFNVKYKEKEIALRKINGANENQIVLMLNKSLFNLFIIAYAIAIPVSYWISKQWIAQFAYRIELHWWVFVVNGLLVTLITLLTVTIKSYRAAIKNPIKSLKQI